jgi:leucyl-tRNA synthetase
MRQWFLRITAYADQLLDGLDGLDWPEEAKRVQREWIGRSRGVEVDFELAGGKGRLSTFTTRPDTLFGVTFLVVPPDHPELAALAAGTGQEAAVRAFAERTRAQAELRAVQARERGGAAARPATPRGVFTGAVASHPATGAALPVWVADYVVSDYGTGAVMGVPGHDQRDHRFAEAQGLPVVEVVRPAASQALPWTGPGVLVASGRFSGMPSGQAASAIVEWLRATGRGRRMTRYRLHDWLISRQRYWGPPIPVVDCGACGPVGVPEAELPVLLPDIADFRPSGSGRSPLAAVESFVRTACPACGGPATRETDVSDTFLDSAWYFLRYPSAGRDDVAWDPDLTARWLPVDLYAGGPEHVARHHLYARFVTRALHDLGLVPFAEPFPRIRLHGVLRRDGAKMSKSRGNVVVPEDYIDRVGADTLRLYLAFCAPWEEGGDFSDRDIAGIERFLARLWQLLAGDAGPQASEAPGRGAGEEPDGSGVDLRPLDRTVHAVGRDIERLKFNTAIAALMELVRWAGRQRPRMAPGEWERTARTLLLLLAPFAPHQAEELWARRGYRGSVHLAGWPSHDPHALEETQVTLVVQVDGRRRDARPAPAGASREQALEIALASDRVRRHLPDGAPRGVVFVPDRLINLLT